MDNKNTRTSEWLRFLILMVAVLSASAHANVEWESIGPAGGDLYGIEQSPTDPDTLFALGFLSVFRSVDGALNWQNVHTAEMGAGLITLDFDPLNTDHLFLGSATNGVFESIDQGDTWTGCRNGLPPHPEFPAQTYPIASLIVGADQRLYAGIAQPKDQPNPPAWIYRHDGDCNWVADDAGISFGAPELTQDIAVLLSKNAADQLWAMVYGGGVYFYDGSTWVSANGNLPANALRSTYLAHDPTNTNRLILATELDWIYETVDGGLTWNVLAKPAALDSLAVLPLVYNIAIDPSNPQLVYVLAIDATNSQETPLFTADFQTQTAGLGGYLSGDGGASWPKIPVGPMVRLLFDPAETVNTNFPPLGSITRSRVWYGTSYGRENLLKSNDGGLTIEPSNIGINSVAANVVWAHPAVPAPAQQMLFVGAESGLYQRIDQAPAWTHQHATPNLIYSWSFADDPMDPDAIFYSTGHPARANLADRGIYRADLNCFGDGCPLSQQLLSDFGVWRIITTPLQPMNIYAATQDEGILVSTDQGGSWLPMNAGLSLPVSITDVALDDTGSPVLAAARTDNGDITAIPAQTWLPYTGEAGGIFRLSNNVWSPVAGLSAAVYALDADPSDPLRFVAATGDGVYETLDGGQNWQLLFGPRVIHDVLINPENPSVMYAANGAGILRSTDGGVQWHDLSAGLWQTFVLTLAFDSGTVFAGTLGGGIFQLLPDPNPLAVVTVNPGSLSFGVGPVGLSQEDLAVTITNDGEADLVINDIVPGDAAFSAVGFSLPTTITPGSFVSLIVRFQPQIEGVVNSQITIQSNDPVTPAFAVPVSGEGRAPIAAAPDLKIDGTDGPLTIANGTTINVSGNLTAGDYDGRQADIWVRHTDPTGKVYWLVDGSGWVQSGSPLLLRSSPIIDQTGYFDASLKGIATGANELLFAVDSNADGVFDATWSDTASFTVEAVPPSMTTGPALIDFGQVAVGFSSTKGFAFANTGEADLVVSAIDIGAADVVMVDPPVFPVTVQNGASVTIQIRFSPQSSSVLDSAVTIHSNDPASPTFDIPMVGEGLAAVAPTPDLQLNGSDGPVTVPSGSSVSVRVNLTAGDYGGQRADFWLRHTDPSGTVRWLVQGSGWVESATPLRLFANPIADRNPYFTLNMAGLVSGTHDIFLAIDDNADNVFDATWSDSATATIEARPPSLVHGPSSISFGQVAITAERAFAFGNSGEQDLVVTAIDVGHPDFVLVNPPVFPATITFGNTITVRVRFTPSAPGVVNTAVTIHSNDPAKPSVDIPMSGEGT